MTLKLRICTAGQSKKFAFSDGRYTSWNLRVTALRPPPSVTVMNVKKAARPTILVSLYPSRHPRKQPTNRCKDQLIKAHPLERRHRSTFLRDRKRSRKKRKPLELHRRHDETVRHEPGQPLKVKLWWTKTPVWYDVRDVRTLLIVVRHFDAIRDILPWSEISPRSCTNGCQGLSHCVCYASQDLYETQISACISKSVHPHI